MTPTLGDLHTLLDEVTVRDRLRLARSLDRLRGTRDPKARERKTTAVAADIARARARLTKRAASVPHVRYPATLPVTQRKDDIAAAIRDHQVVIVAGETGSGKTTQLPKICLELGRGVSGTIGHTQPRRLAARTVAERIAEELDTPLGEAVGYKVRFTEQAGDDTLVKLMTDGILLAEMQRDRLLTQYDTLIIDEAHERSLNIDFLLGYLKTVLPQRPDLKVVITSATIDPQRFSRHFGDAPVIEVSGRTYPVQVRYRPLVEELDDPGDDDEADPVVRDQTQAICEAVQELCGEGPGGILVFLSGEREIRDTADALGKMGLRGVEILPLYGRLSAAEQHRVFAQHTGRPVVLATNVAETSLTVPGISFVVDPGTARISRYSHRTKVQRLPIEAISQASANQRKGRCGRVSDGICIRLYTEEDFLARPAFTDPEILRTNLASVILAMTALGLGDVAAFPFLDPPDRRNIKDGVDLLHELGAIDPDQPDAAKRLTPVGRSLSQLPVDPRLARMVIEAHRNGCVREVMVIAAALSIQDPRERPVERQQAADEKHRRFADETSDFLAYLNLWTYLREQQKALSGSQFRRLCKTDFLNYLRVREWQDLVSQLRQVARGMDIVPNDDPSAPDLVHQSVLAGLLSHIGLKDADKRDFQGARNARFAVFPGSALFKKPPRWVVAAELVETSRLWGRVCARIEPEWAEALGQHLVKRSYSEPHWEKSQGAVMAYEKVTLYGVPLVAARKVGYGRIDPLLSRELFIRNALVEGDWRTHHAFFEQNRALLEEVEELEHRARRRDIVVDDETLYDFYDQRIPADVVSGRHFDSWWKKTRRDQPELLRFTESMLVNDDADAVSRRDYPDRWRQDDLDLAVSYQFEPGADADGVTVHVPVQVLNRLSDAGFDWQIPGLREDLATALIRSLPKALRRLVVPAPDRARLALSRITPADGRLADALADELHALVGVDIPREAWDLSRVPDHLRITFRVEDAHGRRLAEGKDLVVLKRSLQPRMTATMSAAAATIERTRLTAWTFGTLPQTFAQGDGPLAVRGFPALVDEGGSVAVRILGTQAEQARAMRSGVRRLLLLGMPSPLPAIRGRLTNATKFAMTNSPHGSLAALFEDCITCAADSLTAEYGGGIVWDAEAFATLLAAVRGDLNQRLFDIVTLVGTVLGASRDADRAVRATTSLTLLPSLTDIRGHLAALVHPGFVSEVGAARLTDLLRYLQAVQRRLERLPHDARRDQERTAQVQQITGHYQELLDRLPPGTPPSEGLQEIRWMIEELRVSLFAPPMRTAYPVSDKRIYRAMDALA